MKLNLHIILKSTHMGSKTGSLDTKDIISISKGALIMVSGAVLTAIAAITLPALDVSADPKTLIYAVILSVVVNTARKLILNNE